MFEHNSDNLPVERDKPLAAMTSINVGGPAQFYATVESNDDVKRALEWSRSRLTPMWVLSGGSNLIVADKGIEGLVVDLRLRGVRYQLEDNAVLATVAAGENWDSFVAQAVDHGYSGLECLSGIPGRVGATPIQNVGAYGQDVSQIICRVGALDRESGEIVQVEATDCEFGYRTSRFKIRQSERFVIVSVCFRLQLSPPIVPDHAELRQQLKTLDAICPTAQDIRKAVLILRRSKSMLLDPTDPCSRSCGSFFVNPVVASEAAVKIRECFRSQRVPLYPQPSGGVKIAAAWLIEKAGYQRGYRDGKVGISEKHSLALVAHTEATASDVVRLARKIQAAVEERFGVTLMPEPIFWGFAQVNKGLPLIEFE